MKIRSTSVRANARNFLKTLAMSYRPLDMQTNMGILRALSTSIGFTPMMSIVNREHNITR